MLSLMKKMTKSSDRKATRRSFQPTVFGLESRISLSGISTSVTVTNTGTGTATPTSPAPRP